MQATGTNEHNNIFVPISGHNALRKQIAVRLGLLICACLCARESLGQATPTSTWTAGGSGNWSSAVNWTGSNGGSTPPAAGDLAVFPAGGGGYTVRVDVAPCTARRLDVHTNCTINIDANTRLELGSADGQISEIDGMLSLSRSTSVLRIMHDHVFRPKTTGATKTVIYGGPVGALIDDPGNSSRLILQRNGSSGAATIGCNLALDVGGVRLDPGGQLTMGSCFTLGDCFDAFEIAGGALTFSSAFTDMTCDFVVSAGTLNINANVCTEGDLTFTGGTINVAPGKTFSTGGSCRELDDLPFGNGTQLRRLLSDWLPPPDYCRRIWKQDSSASPERTAPAEDVACPRPFTNMT